MLIVGLTGGIGCGKSRVSRIFQQLGVPVIDSDEIAHQLVVPGSEALEALTTTFGEAYLLPSGQLNRSLLRQRIFSDPEAKQRLEAILHPRIQQAMHEQAAQFQAAPYLLFVIPLLFEAGWQGLVGRILVVDCPPEVQLARLMSRDRITRGEARQMIRHQLDRQLKLSAADDIIDNSGDPDALPPIVATLHQRYLQLAAD